MECLRLASSTATSKIAVPVRRVLANAASSVSTTVWMRAASAAQLGELLPHRVDRDLGQLVHEAGGRGGAAAALRAGQQPQVADGAAQQPPQHVAAALVARAARRPR